MIPDSRALFSISWCRTLGPHGGGQFHSFQLFQTFQTLANALFKSRRSEHYRRFPTPLRYVPIVPAGYRRSYRRV
jgi:hypothetical protein